MLLRSEKNLSRRSHSGVPPSHHRLNVFGPRDCRKRFLNCGCVMIPVFGKSESWQRATQFFAGHRNLAFAPGFSSTNRWFGLVVAPQHLCKARRSGNLLDPPWGLQGGSESFPRSTHAVSWRTVAADTYCYPFAWLAPSVTPLPFKLATRAQPPCS